MVQQQDSVFERENLLQRKLTTRQVTMIALGGAIGTGLFLGSGMAIGYAGPGVLVSYAIGAIIALLMMYCLSEMAVAHPTAGSFGSYAEKYIGRWAGFVVRYTYWGAQVIAIGGEATAVALYMHYWFPAIPNWMWIVIFSVALVIINALSVGNFGTFEYWFAMIKVVAIIAFIILGAAVVFGASSHAAYGFGNYVNHGGFMPNGFHGVWMGVLIGIFSFIGVEVVAVTSGEAQNPEKAIPRAMRTMVFRLVLFYILALAVMLAIVPWTQAGAKVVTESPFVVVFAKIGIPYAAGIMNFVVLTAALSSMNTNLYLCTRMIFSLSCGGYAPRQFGNLRKNGVPLNALLVSSVGLAISIVLNIFSPNAYGNLFGIAVFGAIFVWIMIFITFMAFRPKWKDVKLPFRAPLYPIAPIVGVCLLLAILLTMLADKDWRFAWEYGVPWLVLCLIGYFIWGRKSDVSTDLDSKFS